MRNKFMQKDFLRTLFLGFLYYVVLLGLYWIFIG
jgi:hypothetical protein